MPLASYARTTRWKKNSHSGSSHYIRSVSMKLVNLAEAVVLTKIFQVKSYSRNGAAMAAPSNTSD